jgi:hypothetical protein
MTKEISMNMDPRLREDDVQNEFSVSDMDSGTLLIIVVPAKAGTDV